MTDSIDLPGAWLDWLHSAPGKAAVGGFPVGGPPAYLAGLAAGRGHHR